MFLFTITAVLNWDVINKSFADCLKLKSSLILISFLTDLAPFVSHANFVINNFSSGLSTFPVIKILPSITLVLTERRYFYCKYFSVKNCLKYPWLIYYIIKTEILGLLGKR